MAARMVSAIEVGFAIVFALLVTSLELWEPLFGPAWLLPSCCSLLLLAVRSMGQEYQTTGYLGTYTVHSVSPHFGSSAATCRC